MLILAIRCQLAIRGFTQIDISEATGLSRGTVSLTLRGISCKPKTRRIIGAFIGLDLDEVLPVAVERRSL